MRDASPDRVFIFDTTLRDGEQSPGFHLDANSKLRIARQLERLGVDVIEAGFPISSPGDFEACRRIAREIRGTTVTALARAVRDDIDAEALELARDAQLGVGVEVESRRLLAVAQRRVEDEYAVWGCVSHFSTGSNQVIIERSSRPTCSIW